MYTEQQFIQLEEDERALTNEEIALMLLLLAETKGNIEKELRNFYSKYGKDGVVTYSEARKWISEQNHQRRLTALLLFISGEFVLTYDKLTTHFHKFLTDVVSKEAAFFGVEIDIEKILTRKWGLDDLYWLERLEADVNLWKIYIANDVKRSLHRGATIDEVLKLVDKRFTSIDSILKKLGMTESTAVGSLSRQAIFSELGITKYQFYTRPDERRCETCGSMHGLIFPISAYEVGVTASPIHPWCRCWEVPIMD